MSAPLGEQIGLGTAPDTEKVFARACYFRDAENNIENVLPTNYSIHKRTMIGAETDAFVQEVCMMDGKIKSFGVRVITSTLTTDATVQLRKNAANFGTSIVIPQAVLDGTAFFSAKDLDIEFVIGDKLNYQVTGTGSAKLQFYVIMEWESDVAQFDFPSNIYQIVTEDQATEAVRFVINNDSTVHTIEADANGVIPANTILKANASYVASGFPTNRTHEGHARANGVNELSVNFIIGETGAKFNIANFGMSAGETLGIRFGQVSFGLEPMTTMIVFEVDE